MTLSYGAMLQVSTKNSMPSYTDDMDLNGKFKKWKNYYNFDRPHGAFNDKTPCEVLRERIRTHPVSTVV